MAAVTSDHFNYEYMNENEIDQELKCDICKEPLQSPVSLSTCNHTFCKECIKQWFNQKNSCPTCRQVDSNSYQHHGRLFRPTQTVAYVEINTKIIFNQLDRLLVRCLTCGQTNIQRGHYQNHEKICEKKIVLCPAADIECPWKGPREELTIHLNDCSFEKLRPIINELKNELQMTKRELQNSVDTLNNKVDFLLKLINKGNLMTQECTMPMNECKYGIMYASNTTRQFYCSVCNECVQRDEILLHNCSGDCICHFCVNAQYSNDCDQYEESSTHDDEDDTYDT
jgi:hypothetical protein